MSSNPLDMEKQPLLTARDERSSRSDENSSHRSLSELQQAVFRAQREYMQAWSRTTSGKWHRRIMYAVTLLLTLVMVFCFTVIAQDALSDDAPSFATRKVPLEAHIMSKCPDARDCLHDLILPTMQQVGDQVDFKLSYIGTETDHDDGVLCMHGPQECLGNIIELCAAHLYPDPKIYLGFVMCLTRDYEQIPGRELVADCALEHGISVRKLNDCSVDNDGSLIMHQLQDSVRRSRDANVTKSCTVRLDGEVRCVRDGGEWYDCEGGHEVKDLVQEIKNLTQAGSLW